MKKRDFIKTTGLLTVGTVLNPLASCDSGAPQQEDNDDQQEEETTFTPFELPALDYAFDALEPNIDAETMEIHHGKHHAGYTRKFNKALEGSDWAGKPLEEILAGLQDNEDDINLRNNGGGYYNHKLFWKVISPNGGGEPTGALAEAINGSFDSFENFAKVFKDAAKNRFGSGWAWLYQAPDGKLAVTDTPNQDNPLMSGIIGATGKPILGIDVWEHAYYLNYQNRRGEYINNFFNVINWEQVAKNLAAI